MDVRSVRVTGAPGGAAYDWYQRGMALLTSGDAAASVQLLLHAAAAEPAARSIQEALGRAHYDAGQLVEARDVFADLVARDPADDYARFALGLSLRRLGLLTEAIEQFALAAAMRPELAAYSQALRESRATVTARL